MAPQNVECSDEPERAAFPVDGMAEVTMAHTKRVVSLSRHATGVALAVVATLMLLSPPGGAQQCTSAGSSGCDLNGGPCEGDCDEAGGIWFEGACIFASPIVIAIGRSSSYTLVSATDGVKFDIDGDGVAERVAWTPPDSDVSFLAVDRDGDGQITSGKELFGNFTMAGSPNGFDALQKMAMETNGGLMRSSVSSDDPLFARLLLWNDANHNGISEASELRPASERVSDIGLGYQVTSRRDTFGNFFRFKGWVHVRTEPGRNTVASARANNERTRSIYDVYLQQVR